MTSTPPPVGWFRRSGYFSQNPPHIDHAVVGEVMRPGVLTCQPDTPLKVVAQMMAANHVHTVLLAAGEGETIRRVDDIALVQSIAGGGDESIASDAARDAETVRADMPAIDAARLMAERGVAHLVVVDEDGGAMGVLSSLDIAALAAWGFG
jgi:CBS domain-containing protein